MKVTHKNDSYIKIDGYIKNDGFIIIDGFIKLTVSCFAPVGPQVGDERGRDRSVEFEKLRRGKRCWPHVARVFGTTDEISIESE